MILLCKLAIKSEGIRFHLLWAMKYHQAVIILNMCHPMCHPGNKYCSKRHYLNRPFSDSLDPLARDLNDMLICKSLLHKRLMYIIFLLLKF